MENDFLVVVGSCNVDLTCYVQRMPCVGETMYGDSFYQRYGGKGANQAVAAKKLGAAVCMVAKVGDDGYGHSYVQLLEQMAINTSEIQRVPSVHTGIAQILVSENGANHIVIVPGANKCLRGDDLLSKSIRQKLATAKVGLFQFEIDAETTQKAMELMKTSGKGTVILNCAPAIKGDKNIHSLADILILNEIEVFGTVGVDVSSLDDVEPAMQKLLELGSNVVIITLGSKGAVFASRDDSKVTHVAVTPVDEPVDTTGAGDAFCGAIAYAFIKCQHLSLHQKISFACKAARHSVFSQGNLKTNKL
ncbi:ribokinase isoform X2 [Nilaparvata lugens]|uniref:ribokinase isoform X2 n=1 Tax=Nilaparvata lugens TaxID=108931 RepID=UPI000B9980FE|nr:ribokinase isoform X2 [Nilaparvata lugens]